MSILVSTIFILPGLVLKNEEWYFDTFSYIIDTHEWETNEIDEDEKRKYYQIVRKNVSKYNFFYNIVFIS
jgi:hypothetical protein